MDGDFTSNGFMKRTGAGSYTVDTNTYLTAVPSGYLQNVSEDSSPQLGANLDVQTNEITTSTSNGNIKLNPSGTGVVEIKGDGSSTDGTLQLNCSQNSHGVKIKSPPHSAGASYTLTLPNDDGDANQVLKTDGSGNLDWVDQSSGGGGGSPGGSDTQVQYNSSGSFAGSSNLTFDGNDLTVGRHIYAHDIFIGDVSPELRFTDSDNNPDYQIRLNSGVLKITDITNSVDKLKFNTSGTTAIGTLTATSFVGDGSALTNLPSGSVTSDAQGNTVAGTNAGDSFSGTSAVDNTLYGKDAGTAITTGDYNVAVGDDAGEALTTGSYNTIIGGNAASQNMTTGSSNTTVGYNSMSNASGTECSALGRDAGQGMGDGTKHVAIGRSAFANTNQIGGQQNNIVIGYNADVSGSTVSNEVTIGDTNITKFRIPGINVVLKDNGGTPTNGHVLTVDSNGEAGFAAASGGGGGGVSSDSNNNTVGGTNAGDSITTGTHNTFFGKDAGTDITDAQFNTFIGSNAGSNTNSGTYANVFIGYQAGANNGNGHHNVFIGLDAGLNNEAWDNVFIGNYSGDANTSGTQNVFVGKNVGTANTTGSYNTVLGHEAGKSLTTSSYGVYIGYQAGKTYSSENQFGASTVCIGAEAGETATGVKNTLIGTKAGQNLGSGSNCVLIGNETAKLGSASYNIAVGTGVFNGQAYTGGYNVGIGFNAGNGLTSGVDNTFLGTNAGSSITEGDNNTCIGHDATLSSATVNNEITLGDSNIATLRCNVQTISSLSDRRDKTDINTLDLGLDFVKSLNPVKFKWETRDGNGKDGSYEAGFIAQDFQQLQKDNDADYLKLVMDENPDRLEASYGKLIPVLVKAIQELTTEIETLKLNG